MDESEKNAFEARHLELSTPKGGERFFMGDYVVVVGPIKLCLLLWGGLLALWVLSLSFLARRPLAVFFLDAYTLTYLFIPLALTQLDGDFIAA